MSGRKLDPVWVHFDKKQEKKGIRAICKHCGKEMQPLVARLKQHLKSKCVENVQNIRNGKLFI